MRGLDYARSMAAYNGWMNERLYECCARLGDDDRKRDAGAFFKSIHGTLNHLLLGDRIWMGRFTGRPFAVKSLDQELYADFGELRDERRKTDADISQWAAGLTEAAFASELSYTSVVNPQPRRYPLWFAVTHFFNHQTHHRGQLTTLLFQRGIDPGVTDLIWLPR
ncbi:MAG TPA: DinB family protein [Burkholderiales bacterium]|nr:DinB family protein [Burkholderiales bacterium]